VDKAISSKFILEVYVVWRIAYRHYTIHILSSLVYLKLLAVQASQCLSSVLLFSQTSPSHRWFHA